MPQSYIVSLNVTRRSLKLLWHVTLGFRDNFLRSALLLHGNPGKIAGVSEKKFLYSGSMRQRAQLLKLCIPQPHSTQNKTSHPRYEEADIVMSNKNTLSQKINFELLRKQQKDFRNVESQEGVDQVIKLSQLATLHMQFSMVTDMTGIATQPAS